MIGIPATAAFWTISKLTRPETIRIRSLRGSSPASTCEPITLSSALCRPTSSRMAMSSPAGENSAAACRPPVSSNARCAARSRSGRARITVRATTGPSGRGSQRRATSSMDALPQMPHDAVATKCRSATVASSNGRDRRTTIVSSGWLSVTGSPGLGADDLGPIDQPLRAQEPDRRARLRGPACASSPRPPRDPDPARPPGSRGAPRRRSGLRAPRATTRAPPRSIAS